MTPQDTPEYRAIEQAAENLAESSNVALTNTIKEVYIVAATSPEAERLWKRWVPVTERLPEPNTTQFVIKKKDGSLDFYDLAKTTRLSPNAFIFSHKAVYWLEIPPSPKSPQNLPTSEDTKSSF